MLSEDSQIKGSGLIRPRNIILYDVPKELEKGNWSGPKPNDLQDADFPALMLTPGNIILEPMNSLQIKGTMEFTWTIQVAHLFYAALLDLVWLITKQHNIWWLADRINIDSMKEANLQILEANITNSQPALASLETSFETWAQQLNVELVFALAKSRLVTDVNNELITPPIP
jgi:hypothetical protein